VVLCDEVLIVSVLMSDCSLTFCGQLRASSGNGVVKAANNRLQHPQEYTGPRNPETLQTHEFAI
jgi:hypothetical protein